MTTAEDIMLQQKIPVLDHGYIQLVDWMGDDEAIVDDARQSIAGENVQAKSTTEGLIRYLMGNHHTTPFEGVVFKFQVKLPIFVERQWIRHRTASTNEMSARYGELPEEFYVPAVEDIQMQATKNKQGRSDEVLKDAAAHALSFKTDSECAFGNYRERLNDGMARELARINLPLSTYTQKRWTANLHNIFHFLWLRQHPHAQMEIRVFADAMASIIKKVVPIAFEAYEDFRLNAVTFSATELKELGLRLKFGSDKHEPEHFKTKREYEAFLAKLKMLLS